RPYNGQPFQRLEQALRALPLPPPKDLKAAYVEQLDKEVDARTERLGQLETRIQETEESLQHRLTELDAVSGELDKLREEIQAQQDAIKNVSDKADADIRAAWNESLNSWN